MSLDLCLKQLHVVHIKVFHRMQYICLLLFCSVIFQSVIFSPSFSSPANSSHPWVARLCDSLANTWYVSALC